MASQAPRARIVDEGHGSGPTSYARLSVMTRALCGARATLCVLFSLLVFVACASIHSVARTHDTDSPMGANLTSCAGESDAFFAEAKGPAQYRQNGETLPICELDALAIEEAEEDGELDGHTPRALAARVMPTLLCLRQTLGAAPTAYPARFLISCALPRGPPSTSC